jgi:UDP-N-acetylmuramate dehydrogenase
VERLRLVNWGIKGTVLMNVPMKRYTSMKVGGPVKYLVYPADETDLMKIIHILREESVKYRFVGNGTNIIVDDKGFKGAVIRITKIRHLQYQKTQNGAVAKVSGGTSLKGFIKDSAMRGLAGLEKLYWIPGTVGGGIKMNAGSFGASISDVLDGVTVVNDKGNITSVEKKGLSFNYRSSPVKVTECVINGIFHLKTRDREKILEDMEYVFVERKKRHPMEFPSSGSVFKSVDKEPAWQYVEKAGLRGFRIGDACVSDKHTNFIVNLGHATARDIKTLIDKIKKEVFEKLGVTLEEEVEMWGFNS